MHETRGFETQNLNWMLLKDDIIPSMTRLASMVVSIQKKKNPSASLLIIGCSMEWQWSSCLLHYTWTNTFTPCHCSDIFKNWTQMYIMASQDFQSYLRYNKSLVSSGLFLILMNSFRLQTPKEVLFWNVRLTFVIQADVDAFLFRWHFIVLQAPDKHANHVPQALTSS